MDFFAVKVDGSDVIAGISLYENLLTDSRYDITIYIYQGGLGLIVRKIMRKTVNVDS